MSILGNTNNNILTVAYHCAEETFPYAGGTEWELPELLSNLNCIYVEATCEEVQFTTQFSVRSGETYTIHDPDKFGSNYYVEVYFQRDRPGQRGYIEWRELGTSGHEFNVVASNMPYFDQDHRDIDLVLQQNDSWPTFPYTFNSTEQGYEIGFAQDGASGVLQSNYWLPLRLHALANGAAQTNQYLYWNFNTGAYGTATETMFTLINNTYGRLVLKPETGFWPAQTSRKLYGDMWVAICPHVSAAPGQLLLLGQDALKPTGQSQLYTIQRNYQFDTDKHITCMPESVYVNDREANVGYDFVAANETDHGFYLEEYGSATTQNIPTKNGFAAPAPAWGDATVKKGILAIPYNRFLIDRQSGYILGPATTSTSATYLKASNMCPIYIHASYDSHGKVLWVMPTTASGARNPLGVDADLTAYTYCTKDTVTGLNNQLYMLFAYNDTNDTNNINSFVSTVPTLQNALCSAINSRVDEFFINGRHYSVTRNSSSPQAWSTQVEALASTLYSLKAYGVNLGSQNEGQRLFVTISGNALKDSSGQKVYTDQTIIPNEHYSY